MGHLDFASSLLHVFFNYLVFSYSKAGPLWKKYEGDALMVKILSSMVGKPALAQI